MAPVVRKYGGRQVSTAAIPGVRKQAHETAESLGANVARERGRTGLAIAGVIETGMSQLTKIVEQERDRADSVALLDAENRASQWRNTALFGEGGVYSKLGKDAMELPEAIQAEWTKVSGEIAATLGNPRQREAWAKYQAKQRVDLDLQVQRHVSEQRSAYQAEELKSGLTNTASYAISNSADLSIVGEQIQHGLQLIETHGKQLGKGPESIKAERLAWTTQVHEGVIGSMIDNGESAKATLYAEAVADDMDGKAQARTAAALKEGNKREKVQAAVDSILAAGGTLEEQRKKAKEKYSGELEDSILRDLEHEHSLAQARTREVTESNLDKAKAIIDRTGRAKNIPAELMSSLIDAGLGQVVENYEEAKLQGKPVKTDEMVYQHLMGLALSGDAVQVKTFMDANLLEYIGKLSTGDLRQLREAQLKMRRGDPEAFDEATRVTVSMQNDMVDEALLGMGFDPTPAAPGSKDFDQATTDRINAFRRRVRDEVTALKARTGKAIPQAADVQAIVDRLRKPTGQKGGGLFSSGTPVYDFETSRIPDFVPVSSITFIPTNELQEIRASLARDRVATNRAGVPITDADIVGLYNRKHALEAAQKANAPRIGPWKK